MPDVYVADVLCGGGKTTAAINYINASAADARYLFVTPYVNECTRIVEQCAIKEFVQPEYEKVGKQKKTKLVDMRCLLQQHRNIASTHALFPRYTSDMLDIIRECHYTLILDEAYEIAKPFTKAERASFYDELDKGVINLDPDGRARWIGMPPGEGSPLVDLYWSVVNGAVYAYGKQLLIWVFPPEILQAFDRIIVLTYLFEAQTLKSYFDLLEIPQTMITTKYTNGAYQFCAKDDPEAMRQKHDLRNLIHILDNKKLNRIGNDDNTLSSNWYDKDATENDGKQIQQLARNIRNVQKNIYKCPLNQFMWTVYQKVRDTTQDKNIRNTFVTCNQRAENRWRHCQYLAYGINLFEHPSAYQYFYRFGIKLDTDKWALSEMIQWIWRSAIRDGKEIWIYIPSKRMRTLLEDWIAEVSMPQPGDRDPGLQDEGVVA